MEISWDEWEALPFEQRNLRKDELDIRIGEVVEETLHKIPAMLISGILCVHVLDLHYCCDVSTIKFKEFLQSALEIYRLKKEGEEE